MGRVFEPIQRLYTWARRPLRSPQPTFALPDRVALPAVDEIWAVMHTRDAGAPATRIREAVEGGRPVLRLIAPTADSDESRAALIRWLKRRARTHLERRLADLSNETGIGFERLRIGLQRTRWGSCSSRGTISLNAALLFLPPEWVDYVLIHELCHRRHLNHSPAFWRLLAEKCPNSRRLARETRHARRRVPTWAIPPRRSRKRS